ncbi:MAG TPA: hypothetical protein VNH45_14575, partial [Gaiellaceae bacterium]|nr:hypothetical protein [Gaiellaceae bacterium]
MRRLLRRRLRLVPLALAALAVAAPASATNGLRIRSVDTSGSPAIRLTLVAPLHAATPRLTENGAPVAGYTA